MGGDYARRALPCGVERLYATGELTVPMSFILDDTGTVIELIPGWSERTRRRFEELVDEPEG